MEIEKWLGYDEYMQKASSISFRYQLLQSFITIHEFLKYTIIYIL
jgi:hypothetical protein